MQTELKRQLVMRSFQCAISSARQHLATTRLSCLCGHGDGRDCTPPQPNRGRKVTPCLIRLYLNVKKRDLVNRGERTWSFLKLKSIASMKKVWYTDLCCHKLHLKFGASFCLATSRWANPSTIKPSPSLTWIRKTCPKMYEIPTVSLVQGIQI